MFWVIIIVLMLLGGLGGETIQFSLAAGVLAIAFRLIYNIFEIALFLTLSKICLVVLIIIVVISILGMIFG